MTVKTLTLTTLVLAAAIARASEHDIAPDSTGICELSKTVSPGDTVSVSDVQSLSGSCLWTTPGVTIRGAASGGTLAAAAGADVRLIIAAPGVTLENLSLNGVGVQAAEGDFTLRNVRISGASTGLFVSAERGAIHVENSVFERNGIDIDAGQVDALGLSGSSFLSAVGVITRARENTIETNRFIAAAETETRALAIVDSITAKVANNVFRAATPGNSIFIDALSEKSAQQITLLRNTFVSHAGRGSIFVETLGSAEPVIQAAGNVFWGSGGFKVAEESALQADSYVGTGEIFADRESLRVDPNTAAGDRGAVSAAAPVAAAPVAEALVADAGTTEKAAVRASMPSFYVASINLQSTAMAGAGFLFSNTLKMNAAVSGPVTVSLKSSNPGVVLPLMPVVIIPPGASSATFALRTFAASAPTSVTISATANGVTTNASIKVGPVSLESVSIEKSRMGSNATTLLNRVYLTGPASGSAAVVYLRSSNSAVQVPSSVTVGVGVDNAAFTIKTGQVSSPVKATITATYGSGSVSQTVTVGPAGISNAIVAPLVVAGGSTPLFKIYLSGPAPAGGLTLRLNSSDPSVVSLPPTVTVPAGMVDVSVPCRTSRVSNARQISLTASDSDGSRSAAITINPVALSYLYLSTSYLRSGNKVKMYILLTGPAPAGGLSVAMHSSSSLVSVPSSITVPEGDMWATYTATAGRASSSSDVSVTASYGGTSRTAKVTLAP